MSSFQQRLVQLMSIAQIATVAHLARRLGYDRSERVRKVFLGKNQPSLEMLNDLAIAFPDINPRWLITGEGEPHEALSNLERIGLGDAVRSMKADGEIPTLRATQPDHPADHPTPKKGLGVVRNDLRAAEPEGKYIPMPVVSNREDESRIVMLDSRVAAGFPGHAGDAEFLQDQPVMHLPGFRYKGQGLIALQVTGDSMSPTIKHLDWLVARPLLDPAREVVEGYVHVLVTRDGCVAKRLFRAPRGRHAFICKSDNVAYPQYEQPVDGDERIYMALAILSEDLSNRANDTDLRLTRLERDMMALQQGLKGR